MSAGNAVVLRQGNKNRKSKPFTGGKDKREKGGFSAWPHVCAQSPNFVGLSITAKALLFELLGQYRGNNNGDLCCARKTMKASGWKARSTVERARDELWEVGWIVRTQQGGRNRPNLYALTFHAIDPCDGKVDRPLVGKKLSYWKDGKNPEYPTAKTKTKRKGAYQTRALRRGNGISFACPAERQGLPQREANR